MPENPSPVVLVGTGRCGSTIVQSMLAMHPDLGWPSTWTELVPSIPAIAVLNRLWGIPGMDRFRETRFLPKPAEPQALFERHLTRVSEERPTAEDVAEMRENVRPYVERLRRAQGKSTFLMKYVGRPVRISLTAAAFPTGVFVDLQRDFKATVSSVLRVDFYDGWGTLDDWPWDEIPRDMVEFHRRTGGSEAVGVAIGLKLNRLQIEQQLESIDPSRRLRMHYSDFVKDPLGELERITDLADLSFTDSFQRRLEARRVRRGANQKWKDFFSREDTRYLAEFEERFGI